MLSVIFVNSGIAVMIGAKALLSLNRRIQQGGIAANAGLARCGLLNKGLRAARHTLQLGASRLGGCKNSTDKIGKCDVGLHGEYR